MWAKLLVSLLLLTFATSSKSQEAGQCENGITFLPDESSCEKYYVCLNGKPQLMQCEAGKSFDYYLEICMETHLSRCYTNEINNNLAECSIQDQLTPNPANCSTYYQCDNGVLVLKPCPPGLHFNPIYQICDKPENAHCEDATTSTASSSSQSTEGSTASQEPTEGTTSTEEPTEGSTASQNPTEGSTASEEPTTTENTEGPTETVTTDRPTTEESTSTTEISTDSPTVPPFKPDCPSNGITTVPNPYDCTSFYVCVNGFSALIYCPTDLYFDQYEQACVPEGQAHCAAVTTTELPGTTGNTESTEGTTGPNETTTKPNEPTESTTANSEPTETTSESDGTTGPNEPSTGTTEGTSAPTESSEQTTETSKGTSVNTEPTTGGTETSSGSTTQGPYQPDCPSSGVAILPNPNDCKSFYVCIEGNSALLNCPSNLWFDSESLTCASAGTAVCYGSTTTEENNTPTASEGTTEGETTPETSTTEEPTATTSSEGTTDTQTTPEVTDNPTTTESGTEITEQPTTSQPTETTSTSEEPTTSPPYIPNCPSSGFAELANPDDCKTFFICIQGHFVLLECPLDLYFDAITLSCVPASQVTCYDSLTTTSSTTEAATTIEQNTDATSTPIPTEITSTTNSDETTTLENNVPVCPPKGIFTFPDPTSCGSFYVCINGLEALINCPIGEEFNAQLELCQTPDLAHCQIKSSLIFGLFDEQCKEGEMTPNYEDCTKYYVCSGGKEILMDCPNGLFFNENLNSCDMPQNSPCWKTSSSSESTSSSSSTETSSSSSPTDTSSTSQSTETTSTSSPTETSSPSSPTQTSSSSSPTETSSTSSPTTSTSSPYEPDCPSEGTTTLANPEDCETYFVCVNGEHALLHCPPSYQFDSIVGNCVPFDGTCESGTTSPPITTTVKPYEPDCPSEGVSYLPNPENCTSYYVCINGEHALLNCPTDYEFNPDLKECVPSSGNCSGNSPSSSSSLKPTTETTNTETSSTESSSTESSSSSISTTSTEATSSSTSEEPSSTTSTEATSSSTSEEPSSTTSTEVTSSSTETTSQGSSTSNKPDCDKPIYPNPDDCGSYYLCDNGVPIWRPCPPGLEFSPNDLVCEAPEVAHCGSNESSKKFKFNIFNLF